MQQIINGEVKDTILNEIEELYLITNGNYELALELIAFRQYKNTNYYVNGFGIVAYRHSNNKLKLIPILDKGIKNKDKKGYQQIKIENSKPYVHRMVAECFFRKFDYLTEVNHMDTLRHNNKVWNLEWCTKQANIEHRDKFQELNKMRFNGNLNIKFNLDFFIYESDYDRKFFRVSKDNKIFFIKRKKNCSRKILELDFKREFFKCSYLNK